MGQSGWKELHKRIIVVLYKEKDSYFLKTEIVLQRLEMWPMYMKDEYMAIVIRMT